MDEEALNCTRTSSQANIYWDKKGLEIIEADIIQEMTKRGNNRINSDHRSLTHTSSVKGWINNPKMIDGSTYNFHAWF